MTVPPVPAVPGARARATLLVSPDWRRPMDWLPALSLYITAAPADGGTCLCLDAREAELPVEVVRSMVVRACEYVGEGRPFADVLLLEDGAEPPGDADPVERPAELAERLGLTAPAAGRDALSVVTHARWAKTLVDALQAEVDRADFAAAPAPDPSTSPLVTVRIPTYGRVEDLVSRAIPSVLTGAYDRVEVLVCSDGPQPHAREAVAAIEDPRVRYLELAERPVYPTRPQSFWQTAGAASMNRLLDEARGDFIAPLDHDDAFTVDHVTSLLAALERKQADFAYGQAMTEMTTGAWGLIGSAPLAHGRIVHASVLYSRRLAHMRYDLESWLLDEPADWNLWRRMQAAGASVVHLAAPIAVHFREGSSIAGRADARRTLDAAASDVLETPARRLLEVAYGAAGLAAPARTAGGPAGRTGASAATGH